MVTKFVLKPMNYVVINNGNKGLEKDLELGQKLTSIFIKVTRLFVDI